MEREDFGAEVSKLALPLLVERLGGTVEISHAEYDAFMERHREEGLHPAVRIDYSPRGLRLTVIHAERPPLN